MTISRLEAELEIEKEYSAFLEELLKTLYGDGWEKLTLYDAEKWRTHHLSNSSEQDKILPKLKFRNGHTPEDHLFRERERRRSRH